MYNVPLICHLPLILFSLVPPTCIHTPYTNFEHTLFTVCMTFRRKCMAFPHKNICSEMGFYFGEIFNIFTVFNVDIIFEIPSFLSTFKMGSEIPCEFVCDISSSDSTVRHFHFLSRNEQNSCFRSRYKYVC